MADYNIKVPIASFEATERWSKEFGSIQQGLAKIKANKRVSDAVKECSKNSNVPEELMFSLILALSNGNNNSAYKSTDFELAKSSPLVRSGYFALSNFTARVCLINELQFERINTAERAYLNKYGNVNVQNYILTTPAEKDKTLAKWWATGKSVNVRLISDANCLQYAPFNLESPEVSIAIGAIMLGQCWDYFAKYFAKPLVPVVASMLLPFDYYLISGSFYQPFNTSILRPPLNNIKDWDSVAALEKLPRPKSDISSKTKIGENVINPNGGWAAIYVALVTGKNGTLQKLVDKIA